MKQRFKISAASTASAATHRFKLGTDSNEISVEEYFKDHLNFRLNHPDLPLIMKGFTLI
jgi:hypothetical protein